MAMQKSQSYNLTSKDHGQPRRYNTMNTQTMQ
jgi:hypothetical protein